MYKTTFFSPFVDLIFYFLPSTSDFDCRSVIKFSVRLLSPILPDGTDGVGLLHVCASQVFYGGGEEAPPLKNYGKSGYNNRLVDPASGGIPRLVAGDSTLSLSLKYTRP